MHKYMLLLASLSIAACASNPSIDTSPYESRLSNNCIAKLPAASQSDQQAKTRCYLDANARIRMAERTYELRAGDDRQRCKQANADPAKFNDCCMNAQKEYFDMMLK